ncbi:membrane protein [Psittacid alphaherpesvirus 1]|uniref:Envelope protein UL45 n=1 Tax=Psittacid herpesvirus 1 (isolate Amazon parrot/-/97-0001/1997) TaxID=670426 RepID=EV45_PSHV1|nr:membrane protein UL45 [Psittacid alphaherpesvirus 1]Q6UDL6.1 RecName: Full=Envelope protein UL45 [Psittacid herpesvirus 1 Amazon parrot/1997]AAQ73694.1 membrane protein [Psittacid alphaherpesvirus 1]
MRPNGARTQTAPPPAAAEGTADVHGNGEAATIQLDGQPSAPSPPLTTVFEATDDYKARRRNLESEPPFEVRAILDDELSDYPVAAPLDAVPQKHSCCCGVCLRRCAFVLTGMAVGMLLAAALLATIAAFAVPESVWTGGVCERGWVQHMGVCYKPGRTPPPSSAADGNFSAATFAGANTNCAAAGGSIVSSDQALSFLVLLSKTASGPNSAPPRGSWWTTHSGSCAIVHYAPSSTLEVYGNTSSLQSLALRTRDALDVSIAEDTQCSGSAGVMCAAAPAPPTALKYAQALRAILTLGVRAE